MMSHWRRFHQNETITAMALPEQERFLIRVLEPPGEGRKPVSFYRSNLEAAREAADQLVQEYYPHECDERTCGEWWKAES